MNGAGLCFLVASERRQDRLGEEILILTLELLTAATRAEGEGGGTKAGGWPAVEGTKGEGAEEGRMRGVEGAVAGTGADVGGQGGPPVASMNLPTWKESSPFLLSSLFTRDLASSTF